MVVPTVGRPTLLRSTLASIVSCRPRAAEVLVVDQGDAPMESVVDEFISFGVRYLRFAGPGLGAGAALNQGLRQARHEAVLITHDDCLVARDWLAVGSRLAEDSPDCLFTGRVLPLGDADAVPSVKEDPEPTDFTGKSRCDVLYPANAVLPRSGVLRLGAFDERLVSAAEDNDLCYRWLKAGHCLRYEPDLLAWHEDWRTADELRDLNTRYGRGQGNFYAKHLRRGDFAMLRFLATDASGIPRAIRGIAGTSLLGRAHSSVRDVAFSRYLRGLLRGLLGDWRNFR